MHSIPPFYRRYDRLIATTSDVLLAIKIRGVIGVTRWSAN